MTSPSMIMFVILVWGGYSEGALAIAQRETGLQLRSTLRGAASLVGGYHAFSFLTGIYGWTPLDPPSVIPWAAA